MFLCCPRNKQHEPATTSTMAAATTASTTAMMTVMTTARLRKSIAKTHNNVNWNQITYDLMCIYLDGSRNEKRSIFTCFKDKIDRPFSMFISLSPLFSRVLFNNYSFIPWAKIQMKKWNKNNNFHTELRTPPLTHKKKLIT